MLSGRLVIALGGEVFLKAHWQFLSIFGSGNTRPEIWADAFMYY